MAYSQKTYTLNEATKKLEYYCTYRERCHKEVILKLKEMRMIPEAIDTIIVHLIKHNYLNEERFAKAFARGKFIIKKWERIRILSELNFQNISKHHIKIAIKEIADEEYIITLDLLAKKRLDQISEKNIQKRKRKLADYLLYRGWESHLVYAKVRELIP